MRGLMKRVYSEKDKTMADEQKKPTIWEALKNKKEKGEMQKDAAAAMGTPRPDEDKKPKY